MPPGPPCYDIALFSTQSNHATVTVQGGVVTQVHAAVIYTPDVWIPEWKVMNAPPISNETILARITGLPGSCPASGIDDPASILLNGTVPIIAGSKQVSGGDLLVRFSKVLAAASIGDVANGQQIFPKVQGKCGSGDVFTASGPVTVQHAGMVVVSTPQPYNPGKQGSFPVQILNTSTAKGEPITFNPQTTGGGVLCSTIKFAGAPIQLKKGGQPQCTFQDLDGDLDVDLVAQVDGTKLQVTPTNTNGVLEARLADGTPIFGLSVIRVKQ